MNDFPHFEIQAFELEGAMEVRKIWERYYVSMLRPHRNNFYILFWATSGKGFHLIDHNQFEILPGRLYFIQPEHNYQVKEYPKKGWMIMFNPSLFSAFIVQHPEQEEVGMFSFRNSSPYLDLKQKLRLYNCLAGKLYQELKSDPQISVLQHYLSILLLHANACYAVQQKLVFITPETQMMLKLKRLISANYHIRRDTKFYADEL